MKNLICLFILLITLNINSQIPVTDVAANTSIGLVNANISITNTKLVSIKTTISETNRLLRNNNKKLDKLIDLLEQNNNISNDSKNIHSEELEAKKNTPEYVLNSTVIDKALRIKNKIVEVYQIGKKLKNNLEYIDQKTKNSFIKYIGNEVLKANNLIKQANNLVNTKSIILPEERISRVEDVNNELENILQNIKNKVREIKNDNYLKGSKLSIINLSKS